jgi:hypothetical protein
MLDPLSESLCWFIGWALDEARDGVGRGAEGTEDGTLVWPFEAWTKGLDETDGGADWSTVELTGAKADTGAALSFAGLGGGANAFVGALLKTGTAEVGGLTGAALEDRIDIFELLGM